MGGRRRFLPVKLCLQVFPTRFTLHLMSPHVFSQTSEETGIPYKTALQDHVADVLRENSNLSVVSLCDQQPAASDFYYYFDKVFI